MQLCLKKGVNRGVIYIDKTSLLKIEVVFNGLTVNNGFSLMGRDINIQHRWQTKLTGFFPHTQTLLLYYWAGGGILFSAHVRDQLYLHGVLIYHKCSFFECHIMDNTNSRRHRFLEHKLLNLNQTEFCIDSQSYRKPSKDIFV